MTTRTLLWVVFWILVLDFIFLLVNSTIPAAADWSNHYMFLAFLAFALFLILGIALLILTLTGKVGGMLGKFLILTASAAVAIPVGFVVLEVVPPLIANIVYWAIVIAFLAGVAGSIISARRERKHAARPA